MSPWTVAAEPYDSPTAAALWRAYYTEVSDRWYERESGHATDPDELERGIASQSGADLAPPTGVLLVARYEGVAAGTAGVRLLDGVRAELTRVFLLPGMRGKGGGSVLMPAAERAALGFGARELVLDTRHDLTESHALYERHGFRRIPAYADTGPYSERWYGKQLCGVFGEASPMY
ncbi:GNAT family N-acetyltransferase [Streptomyces monticola]|uniref:GNAT family N-acetyltransferase n=1 Tax=Streptomyces monticola TaxID=2666263 RepID=A0ABW2JQS9_9ACTN